MEIYTASQARENFFKLVDRASEIHEPIYVVGKMKKAVIVSEESYNSLIETIYLESIPGMKKSIIESSNELLENFSDKLHWDK